MSVISKVFEDDIEYQIQYNLMTVKGVPLPSIVIIYKGKKGKILEYRELWTNDLKVLKTTANFMCDKYKFGGSKYGKI